MLLFIIIQFFAIAQGKGILSGPVELSHGNGAVLPQDQALLEEKVKFQFYYESECPASIEAYTLELEEIVKELGPYLDITTYPYGNAMMELNGTELTIECQHEESECYGNMLHACAIDALEDATEYVPFNSCTMKQYLDGMSNDEAADECGEKLNVDPEPIKECAGGIPGFQLLLHYGVETGKVETNGVPWWYINGVSRNLSDEETLKDLLCAAFKNPPEVCEQ